MFHSMLKMIVCFRQNSMMVFHNLGMLTHRTFICQRHVVEFVNFTTESTEHTFCSIYEAAVVSVLSV